MEKRPVPKLVLVTALLVTSCTAVAEADNAARDGSRRITAPGEVGVQALRPGDCIEHDGSDGAVLSVDAVPCTSAHDAEVISIEDLRGGNWSPDAPRVYDRTTLGWEASALCRASFEENVGTAVEDSAFELTLVLPTFDAWREGTDRRAICLARPKDEERARGSLVRPNG